VEPWNNSEGKETGEEVSLGRLLKRRREERGIELDEAFKATRIRRHTLEALENDQWDELPPQVFVKGFLKTYAEFLGLDKERVLELYERVSPIKGATSKSMKQVRPRTRRWPLSLILALLALAFIASIVFLRRDDISVEEKSSQYLEAPEPVEEEGEEAAVREEEGWDQAQADKTEDLARPESVEETDLTEVAPVPEKSPEEPLTPQFDLTVTVRSRTWIAISVDDQPVKEYLFQPGETFTWKAYKGFDILVGNAGGIDFVLNGTEIGQLGAEGKVVRVKLPKAED
jgi:cytoskeleton protein RodZ